MPTFTPTVLRSLLFAHLNEEQQLTAAGSFGESPMLTESKVTRTVSYLARDVPSLVQTVSLLTCKAILFATNREFKILSCPTLATTSEGTETSFGQKI